MEVTGFLHANNPLFCVCHGNLAYMKAFRRHGPFMQLRFLLPLFNHEKMFSNLMKCIFHRFNIFCRNLFREI